MQFYPFLNGPLSLLQAWTKSWSSCCSSETSCTQSKTPCWWTSRTWPGPWVTRTLAKEGRKPRVVRSWRIGERVIPRELLPLTSMSNSPHLCGVSCSDGGEVAKTPFQMHCLKHTHTHTQIWIAFSQPPSQCIRIFTPPQKSGQFWPRRTFSWRTVPWAVSPKPFHVGTRPAHEQPCGGCHGVAFAVMWPALARICHVQKAGTLASFHRTSATRLLSPGETPGLEFPAGPGSKHPSIQR